MKGKVLIATELAGKIDRWIKLEVQSVMYDVKILEESSFFNPDEVNPGNGLEERRHLQRKDGMEEEEKEKEEEDDDVIQSFEEGETNGKVRVGEHLRLNTVAELAVVHGEDQVLDGVGGPKPNFTDKHLMLDRASVLAGSEDFESVVGDSVGLDEGIIGRPGPLAQAVVVSDSSPNLDLGLSPRQPFSELGDVGRVGSQPDSTSQNNTQPRALNELGVCCSQLPSIILLVDLNDAACRKRRRRQLTNLIRIREELSREPSMVDGSSSSSGDSVQSDLRIAEEVRATMEIGGQLNVDFLPNDDVVLRKMIEIEIKEFAHAREGEGGN